MGCFGQLLLKFHVSGLQEGAEKVLRLIPEWSRSKLLADILSVLALTMSAEGERESLKYRLLGSERDIGSWGHEYVRFYTRGRIRCYSCRSRFPHDDNANNIIILDHHVCLVPG